jgi:hypothetical protein
MVMGVLLFNEVRQQAHVAQEAQKSRGPVLAHSRMLRYLVIQTLHSTFFGRSTPMVHVLHEAAITTDGILKPGWKHICALILTLS